MADQPVWNPSDRDGDVALSDGNRTWQQASGTVGCVRSTVGLSSGKWRIQLTQITANGSACRHGFATAAHSLASAPGESAASWAINGQGGLEHDGSTGTDHANFGNGAVVQLFVDIDTGRIWYGDADGPYSGDPAAGTGAMHSFTPGTTLYLAGGMDGGGSTRGGTLRLLADYTGTAPAGFTDGWGGGGAVGVAAAAGGGATAIFGGAAVLHLGTGHVAQGGAGRIVWAGAPAEAAVASAVAVLPGAGRAAVAGAAAALLAGQMLAAAAAPVAADGRAAVLAAGVGSLLRPSPAVWHAAAPATDVRLGARLVAAAATLAVAGWPGRVEAGARPTAAQAGLGISPSAAGMRGGAGIAARDAGVAATGGVIGTVLGARPAAGAERVGFAGAVIAPVAPVEHAGVAGAARVAIGPAAATVVAGAPVRPRPPPGDLVALLAEPAGDLDWVVVAEPWDAEAGTTVPLRWSTRDFTTGPADDPPHARIAGRVADVELQAALWADRTLFGRSQPARGSVVIENADGALDHLGWATTADGRRRWHFRRRAVRILLGHPSWTWNELRPIFTGEIEQEEFADGRMVLQLRDRLRRLDQPLQPAVFRGDRRLLQSASAIPVALGTRTFVLPDLVTNGQFASSLAGWDAGTGWTFEDGRAAKAAGEATELAQSVATAPDTAWRIRFDVTHTAGTLRLIVDGEPVDEPIAGSGTYRPLAVARGATMRIAFATDVNFAGSLDAVSVRAEPAATVGDAVRIARTGDLLGTWMAGRILSWSEATGQLAVEVGEAVGEGTHADWSIWLRPGEGPVEAAGKNLPVAYGTVRHAEPVDLGSVQGLWLRRIADSPIRIDVDAGHGVHDGGVPLDLAESFPPAAGESFVDAAEGLVWLASRPQYPLTVSCEAGAGGTAAAARAFARPGHHLFRVPSGVAALRAKLWGAGGGHGGTGAEGHPGGGGGFVDATVAVTPGEILRVSVPAGGAAGQGGISGGPGGATGAARRRAGPGQRQRTRRRGGGGAAGLLRDGTPLLLAAGGGADRQRRRAAPAAARRASPAVTAGCGTAPAAPPKVPARAAAARVRVPPVRPAAPARAARAAAARLRVAGGGGGWRSGGAAAPD
ncbi:hypothetical protein STAQ_11680 [Allostella sp. ATCC 35155]|nr:hypothetical protein STAQ_11680 [Stella sp. ATCC 35155]